MNPFILVSKIGVVFLSFFLIQCVHQEQSQNQILETENKTIDRNISSLESSNKLNAHYQKCSDNKKNYLEVQMSTMPFDYFHDNSADWLKKIPIQCIQYAQKNYSGSFAYCVNETDRPTVGAPKPCLTERYTKLIYNAFHDVNDCFNLDPKNSFLQIMIESGFHLNAINRTGFDAGITQFTKNGLHRVSQGEILKRTEQILFESSNPSCARISSTFRKIKADSFEIKNRCSVISLPENPYRALVLHFLHTLRDKMDLDKLVRQRTQIASLVDEALIEQLVYLAYNRGISGTLKVLDGYIQNRQKESVQITREDLDLWKNLSAARKFLKKDPETLSLLKRARIKKLSLAEYAMIHNKNYLAAMAEAGDAVKSIYGRQCF